ncbi:MAG: LPS export ABC transporter periplasmic protein LptC [Candidatus Omnitrophica bacterium]|nr:LPS export ABC transporter periplasmic protein LptC [Candidatus Omnitrophota bacterium]
MKKAYLTLLLIGIVLLGGCGVKDLTEQADQPIIDIDENIEVPEFEQEVQHFKLEGFSKDNKNKWAVEGGFANIVDPNIILDTIQGSSISEDMTVNIKSDSGVYNRQTKETELTGNVVISLSDGGQVFMDHAKWNPQTEKIETDSPVKIVHSGVIIDGLGGMVKVQEEWAILYKNITMKDLEQRIITCDGPLEVVYSENRAILNNNVLIIDPEGTMRSDKVIVHFDEDKRAITEVEWIGNVEAVY